jgi:hypothetical protein
MKAFFNLGVLLVAAFVGLCTYWYMNPHRAPSILRGDGPKLELPQPASPMSNFRPPDWGSR